MDAEATQRAYYDRIGAEYGAHCDDPSSREYRARLYAPAVLRLEAMTTRVQGRRLACVVICQRQKR